MRVIDLTSDHFLDFLHRISCELVQPWIRKMSCRGLGMDGTSMDQLKHVPWILELPVALRCCANSLAITSAFPYIRAPHSPTPRVRAPRKAKRCRKPWTGGTTPGIKSENSQQTVDPYLWINHPQFHPHWISPFRHDNGWGSQDDSLNKHTNNSRHIYSGCILLLQCGWNCRFPVASLLVMSGELALPWLAIPPLR